MHLKSTTVENGIIQPSFGKSKRNSFYRIRTIPSGVLTKDGMPVNESKAIINEREVVRPVPINLSKTEVNYVDADVIYFCIPQNHFGHVLTGTLAFAHILLNDEYKNHKIVFTTFPPTYLKPSEAIKTLLKHLGVKEENILTVDEYTQFRSITIIRPSLRCVRLSRFRKRLFEIDPEFIEIFRAISSKFVDSEYPRKVYFSRSKVSHRPIMFENKIEAIFKRNGYEIVYPELLSLDEQIKLVANADFYACLQGTLEHHSLFLKNDATFITMARKKRKTPRQVLINQLQTTIKQIYLSVNVHPFGDKVSPNIVGITPDLIRFFDEYNFAYDVQDTKLTVSEIDNYIQRCSWRDIPMPKSILKKIHKRYCLRLT